MVTEDRWMLPEGIQELLPAQATAVEQMRRNLLDLFNTWGYSLVVPPLVEFTQSLLLDKSSDLDIQSFKVTDQLSGKTMAVRADITAQVSRIDAHSMAATGINRLCYVGSVLHTKPKAPMAGRSPIYAGVELFGESSNHADIEVIELMLDSLDTLGVEQTTLDLGHVQIYRSLIAAANVDAHTEQQIFTALQRKSATALDRALCSVVDPSIAALLRQLRTLHGGLDVLNKAREMFSDVAIDVDAALDQLEAIATRIVARYPSKGLYIDLGELRGFQYHTGLVFSAYVPGVGASVANGGRYNRLSEQFGKKRAATGFNLDLKALIELVGTTCPAKGIFASYVDTLQFADYVKQLRQRGERVVVAYDGNYDPSLECNRRLILKGEDFVIEPMEEI